MDNLSDGQSVYSGQSLYDETVASPFFKDVICSQFLFGLLDNFFVYWLISKHHQADPQTVFVSNLLSLEKPVSLIDFNAHLLSTECFPFVHHAQKFNASKTKLSIITKP